MDNRVELKTNNGSVALSGVLGFIALILITTTVQDMVDNIFRPRKIVVVKEREVIKEKRRRWF